MRRWLSWQSEVGWIARRPGRVLSDLAASFNCTRINLPRCSFSELEPGEYLIEASYGSAHGDVARFAVTVRPLAILDIDWRRPLTSPSGDTPGATAHRSVRGNPLRIPPTDYAYRVVDGDPHNAGMTDKEVVHVFEDG